MAGLPPGVLFPAAQPGYTGGRPPCGPGANAPFVSSRSR